MRKWISNNLNFIYTFAAVFQAIIAALMLFTLKQNTRILDLTNRQLEATIDPVVTPHMFGNTIRLTNEGSIEIKQICKIAIIGGWFNINTNTISEYLVTRMRHVLQDSLPPGKFIDIDLATSLIPMPMEDIPKDPTKGFCLYGIVLTYRRSADMKPFSTFLPFMFSNNTKTNDSKVFMPLFSSSGSCEVGLTGDNVIEGARKEIIELYKNKVDPIRIE